MPDCTNDMLLDEIRSLRQDFNQFARETGERISTTEADLHGLMGNGQPGRVSTLETAVSNLYAWRWQVIGAAAGSSAIISVIAWFITAVHK